MFPTRAQGWRPIEVLDRAGFRPEEIVLLTPESRDAAETAEATGMSVAQWRGHLETVGGAAVIVAAGQRGPEALAVLADAGATEVVSAEALAADLAPAERPAAPPRVPPAEIRPGMEVVGSDYRPVGWVKRVEMDGIVLDRRPLRRDRWLAMSDIRARIGGWLVLDTPSDRVDITEPFIRPRMGERPPS